jgi:hypothetical protein
MLAPFQRAAMLPHSKDDLPHTQLQTALDGREITFDDL